MTALQSALRTAKRYGDRAVDTNPSHAQREAGNYKKKHIVFQGIPISIENPKGSIRKGLTHDGKPWSSKMLEDYGYIKRTVGHDGDQVDCFVGPNKSSKRVFIVDQLHHHAKKFDEHKCLLGFNTERQAMASYRGSYGNVYDFHHQIGAITEMSIDAFKQWLNGGGGKNPISPDVPQYQDGGRVDLAMDMDALHRYGRPNIRWDKDPARQMRPLINPDQSRGIVDSPYAPEEGRIIPHQIRRLADGGDSGPQITDPLNPFADIPVPSADAAPPQPVVQQQPAIPEGYAVNDAGEVFNKQTGEVIQPAQPPQREGGLMQTVPQFAEMVQTPEGRGKLAAGAEKALGLDQGYIAGPIQKLVVDPVKQLVSGPREAYEGKLTPEQESDWATNAAMALMGTGTVFSKMRPGTLGVFGGPMSAGSDWVALKEAQRLEKMGVPRDEIWEKTGWGRMPYPNSKWFYQIPMRDAELNPNIPQHPIENDRIYLPDDRNLKLSDVLQHPQLYESYPFLKDWTVSGFNNLLEGGKPLGSTLLDAKHIVIAPSTKSQMFNILVHEVNHAIQDHEGFPQGGNWKQFLPDEFHLADAALRMKKSFMLDMLNRNGIPLDAAIQAAAADAINKRRGTPISVPSQNIINTLKRNGTYDSFVDFIKKQFMHEELIDKAHKQYMNLAGEAMSRNAELRAKFTPEQIRQITPYMSIQHLEYSPTTWKDVKVSPEQYSPLTYPQMSEEPPPRIIERPPPYYISPLGFYHKAEAIVADGPPRAPAQQWLNTLRNKGMRADDDAYIGLSKWLGSQTGPVSKQDLMNHIANNRINLTEEITGAKQARPGSDADYAESPEDYYGDAPKYEQYQMGGDKTDYKELKIMYDRPPQNLVDYQQRAYEAEQAGNPELANKIADEAQRRLDAGEIKHGDNEPSPQFISTHFENNPDLVAHARFNTRMINGKKTLFIEEGQSDLHQKGRDVGYQSGPLSEDLIKEKMQDVALHELSKTDAIPDAPFKKTWPEMVMKRLLKYAADNGYDSIAWTPGDVQLERYNLRKHADELRYDPEKNYLTALKNQTPVYGSDAVPESLPNIVGKEAAERLLKSPKNRNGHHILKGEQLEFGGEFHKMLYDSTWPSIVNNLGKKFGSKTYRTEIPTPDTEWYATQIDDGEWAAVNDRGDMTDRSYSNKDQALHAVDLLNYQESNKKANIHMFDLNPAFVKHIQHQGMPYKKGGRAVPLKPGSGQKVVSENIRELHTGKTYARTAAKFGKAKANKQAIAIALSTARKYGKKKAFGGPNVMGLVMRGSSRNLQREGMIHSGIPGRTDKIGMNVMAGSYILPADIPSAIGQGNSMAGGHILKGMFSRPMRVRGPRVPNLMPKPPRMPSMSTSHIKRGLANGGAAEEDDTDSHVPIVAAGGEYVIHPDVVRDIGHGNINAGHKVLDKFVLRVRKDNIKTLKTLPPPKK